jgi:hypothetical protein
MIGVGHLVVEVGVASTTAKDDSEVRPPLLRLRFAAFLTHMLDDDRDFDDRRNQRRRYEEPLASRVGKKFQNLCEFTSYTAEEDVRWLAKTISDNYFDSDLTTRVLDLCVAMYVVKDCH